MSQKRIARIFEECTGQYHYCDDALPYLDARGRGYTTKRQAMLAAYDAGYTHGRGSGVYRDGALRAQVGATQGER